MLNRRTFAQLAGATALTACGSPPALIGNALAQDARPLVARGAYLIKGGAVVTVDPGLGTLPRADVAVRDGRIEAVGADLSAAGAEVIDATDMIVMPGFIDTHYHMWSSLGRNFIADNGFGYFPAKNGDLEALQRGGFLQQRDARAGRDGQCRHHHRTQLVAQYAYARPCRCRVDARTGRRCCAPVTLMVTSTRCRATSR